MIFVICLITVLIALPIVFGWEDASTILTIILCLIVIVIYMFFFSILIRGWAAL